MFLRTGLSFPLSFLVLGGRLACGVMQRLYRIISNVCAGNFVCVNVFVCMLMYISTHYGFCKLVVVSGRPPKIGEVMTRLQVHDVSHTYVQVQSGITTFLIMRVDSNTWQLSPHCH